MNWVPWKTKYTSEIPKHLEASWNGSILTPYMNVEGYVLPLCEEPVKHIDKRSNDSKLNAVD